MLRLLVFAVLAVSSIDGGEGENPKVVQDLLDRIKPSIEKAREEYGRKVRLENEKLCKAIESAMSRETRAGNLDNALALKAALEKARNGGFIADLVNPPLEDLLGDGSAAPSDAIAFKGGRYKYFDEAVSYDEAEKRCRVMGGRLVAVANEEINSFVFKLIDGKQSWIGLRRTAEGVWILSSGVPATYTRWRSGQPNNGNDIYVGMAVEGTQEWDDFNGDAAYFKGFVCEWR